jgi:hypothetical protein
MANINNKPVSLKVDKMYFDRIFEPNRRKLSTKIGRNFTQREYTAYLARKSLRIGIPKRSRKFSPRGFCI